jgi:23S rRNA (adenine2503-C2)-methyltransferase
VSDFAAMTDLPEKLREELTDSFQFFSSTVSAHRIASDGTEKLLLCMSDGNTVECVLMREERRRTICISTQVGCAMGCVFCASGMQGLTRNLTAGEITEQILRLDHILPPEEKITNIVVMGIGEPLANLEHLLQALENVTADGGMGIGARRITISTVGLPAKIRRLAECGKAYNLAVSLHAPNEELRSQIIPVNEGIGLAEVLSAADDYFDKVGRRVSYEYILLGDLNDRPEHARQLAQLLKSRIAHVNLIPMNPVAELPFQRPGEGRIRRFVEILEAAGVPVTVRKRKGADIDAACGQLRLRHQQLGVRL